ncbi:MAG: flagellar biosynthesis protein FlgB [Hyphomonadaceae bacterium]
MAQHAAETQRVSAENIARAGEPGYRAKEVESFSDYMSRTKTDPTVAGKPASFSISEAQTPIGPNGNSVSIEQEIFKSVGAGGQHNMALSVYAKSMQLMKMAIGRT